MAVKRRFDGTYQENFDGTYIKADGALYYALNYCKEASHRFWLSNGFVDDGEDEYGSKRMIKR